MLLAVVGSVFVLSASLTWTARQLALRWSLYDQPVERSLHSVPIPRLGGTAIVATTLLGWLLLLPGPDVASAAGVPLVVGGLVAAVTGLVDDVRGLPPLLKLAGQGLAVVLALLMLSLGTDSPSVGVVAGLWAVGMLTYMNFFNFMDGTDGMAGGIAVLAGMGLAGLAWQTAVAGTAQFALVVAAAAGGFLAHNYPPASIFMGDTGSLFLGYALGFLVVFLLRAGVSPMPPVMVLAPFIFDATVTLLRRAFAGEVVWQAHRSHLYQRMVRHGHSHAHVAWIYYGWTILATALAWSVSIAPAWLEPLLAATAFLPGLWLFGLTRAVERNVVGITRNTE